jgi:queuosine precursor transporter
MTLLMRWCLIPHPCRPQFETNGVSDEVLSNTPKEKQQVSIWFIVVTAVFVTSLITANIIAVKLVGIAGLVFPAAVIIFPVSYIIGDVLTEVYGFHRARFVIWLGFLCNLSSVIVIWIAQILPSASFWYGQAAYEQILGYTPRLLLASFVAYLFGEFANSIVLSKMKIATNGRWLWTRTIGSTMIGQGLDSLVFISIAFFGTIPLSALISIVITQWLMKSFYEVVVTPLTYIAVNFLKREEGGDFFDRDTHFNPLRIADF